MSYHDLHVTTAEIPRTSIFDLPYGYEISCNRVGGWCLWFKGKAVAGEYGKGLRLDVAGHVICDSLNPERAVDPRCTSLSEDGRRCHGDVGHPGAHWAGAMRIWSDTETLLRPIPPGADQ